MDARKQADCPTENGYPGALCWIIFSVWLLGSMAGLGIFEYQAALRGILCIVPR